MNKNQFSKALEQVKAISTKRKFNQTYDLIVKLKGIDLKNQGNQLDFFTQLHYTRGKDVKICALVGGELIEQAKKEMTTAIHSDDFGKYQSDKKMVKKLADNHDFFVAQANLMTKVAAAFGRVLGPKGKMPNPKAGCVVPPAANLGAVKAKLQKTVRIRSSASPVLNVAVGTEGQDEKEIIDNMLTVYDQIIQHVPQEKNNIKDVMLKLTMSKPVKVGAKEEEAGKKAPEKKEPAQTEEPAEPVTEKAPEAEEKPEAEKAEAEKPEAPEKTAPEEA